MTKVVTTLPIIITSTHDVFTNANVEKNNLEKKIFFKVKSKVNHFYFDILMHMLGFHFAQNLAYSVVTDLAKLRGQSTLHPRKTAM